jgi:ribosomal protein S18 acetylase RimI-like enzyme
LVLTFRAVRRADAAVVAGLWTAANTQRQAEVGLPLGPVAGADIAEAEHQVRRRLTGPASFALLVEEDSDPVAMALVLQALAQDGASQDPLPGIAHISMVAVRPDRWGRGLGALVLDLVQHEARDRGFTRAQLWTHETNRRAQRLYERLGWVASGRTKIDHHGEWIRHYVREL